MSFLQRFRVDHGNSGGLDAQPSNSNEEDGTLSDTDEVNGREQLARCGSSTPWSLPSTPSGTRQRARSDSTELVSERELKRRKHHAAEVCKDLNLSEGTLDNFAAIPTTAEMLITLQGTLLSRLRDKKRNAAREFIHSEDFKEILKERLRACLLSPNLTAYWNRLPENILAFAKKNLETFKIPAEAMEDPELVGVIEALISQLLTSHRSNMKQKVLVKSLTDGIHISQLSRLLASRGGYETTSNHWARFSFLRATLATFKQVVDECSAKMAASKRAKKTQSGPAVTNGNDADSDAVPANAVGDGAAHEVTGGNGIAADVRNKLATRMWTQGDFWEFVDLLLLDIRNEATEKEETPEGHKKYLELFFTGYLQADLKKYPGTTDHPSVPAFDQVTIAWHKAIYTGLIWC